VKQFPAVLIALTSEMKIGKKYLLLIWLFILLGSGCDMQVINNDSVNKFEYSILQAYEYEYRDMRNDGAPYLIIKNALQTDMTVVAFPIKGKKTGYVFMLAQARGFPKGKFLPEVAFTVTKSMLEDLKTIIPISKEVESFIAAQIF
jgi:hypothetical protein